MNETATEIASLQQDNARLRQENTRLKKSKNKLGLTYKTTAENGDAQRLLQGSIPLLKRIDGLSVVKNDNEPNHLLIEGDNISSLTILQQTHREKVDVIYIDPPYNTGNEDFVYNDNFKDKQPKGVHYVKRDDSFRHSKWLSFMAPRLELAKTLLKDTGVIFVSIDDNEQAYLKVLMDRIFGEQNFVANIKWKSRTSLQYSEKLVSSQHEYILVYSLNKEKTPKFNLIPSDANGYLNPDNDPRGSWKSSGIIRNDGRKKYTITTPSGRKYTESWLYTEDNMNLLRNEGRLWFGKNGDSKPRKKSYVSDFQGVPASDYISSDFGSTEKGTSILKSILGDGKFQYPKPHSVIKFLLNLHPSKDALVLDFFAGSGTTGQAVAELNKEDGGTRQAILCTNNFEQDGAENGIARGITAERMRRVLTGKDWADGKEHDALPGNLTYYQVSFRNNESYINDYVENFTASQISGIAALETNVHNVLGAEDFDNELTREFIDSGKIAVLSSSSRIVLVYGDLHTALYFDEKFEEVEQSVKAKSNELGKSFAEYLISYNDDKTSEIDETTTVDNFPIPYVNSIESSVRTLEVKRLLIRPEDSETTENDNDEGAPMNDN